MRFDKFALRFGILEFPDIVRIVLDHWLMRFAMGLPNSGRKADCRAHPIANWQTAAPQNPEYRSWACTAGAMAAHHLP
jgi:hypothetical protein